MVPSVKHTNRRKRGRGGRMAGPLAAMLLAAAPAPAQEEGGSGPLVPESFSLAEPAARAIDAEWLTDEERAALRVRHGVWDERDLRTPTDRAIVALTAWRFDDPALRDETVPVELRATALVRRGALNDAIEMLDGADSLAAGRLRVEAYAGLGAFDDARAAIAPIVRDLQRDRLDDADALTDAVRVLMIRARIDGQPARDYESMLSLLARAHQELDRLSWRARLAEGELLLGKYNVREGVAALHEALALNPRCAEAWYALGFVALERFDFDSAARAVDALDRIAPDHPLGRLLYAESRLVQNDPEEARAVVERLLRREPRLRPALALAAAANALLYDDEATRAAMDRFDALSPGSAEALYAAGRHLSMFRQYDLAAAMLAEAIEREPAWPAPRLELGLMEMQTGRDDKALSVLREMVELDPFNKRIANSLFLLEELTDYGQVETEHFVIRYRRGVDEVLVDLMPEPLERIHRTVTERFGWEPAQRTIIELMPDHGRFAVRITGMPHIHTIAACTGPIIAMEAPRDGPRTKHLGTFDWVRVIQHEYTHTITLDQTQNRIPHWLTEAAAVSMEMAPRDYETCVQLAESYRAGTLFDLDEIKWAFVRPKRPGDRGKAYAQGHWMVEYMNERFGMSALVRLLERYFDGEREEEAMPRALGISREEFFAGFLVWAGRQVEAWGLDPEPSLLELTDELRWMDPDLALMMVASQEARLDAIAEATLNRVGAPATTGDEPLTGDRWPDLVRPPVEIPAETLLDWRAAYPDHPDILLEDVRRRIAANGGPDPSLVPLLERAVELRPVDVYPHRKLAQIHLAGDDPARAIPHLEALDVREQKTAVYARQLATLYREAGDTERALEKSMRTVHMDAYDPGHRELAAAIAIEANRLDLARLHVKALTLLEPDRPRHAKRLERLDQILESRH